MRFHMISLGCAKNDVDSEMMATLLRQAGHVPVAKPRRADLVIVNTCGFIEIAREESYGMLAELARKKRRGQLLVAAGCLAQRYAAEVYEHVPGVDAVIGTQNWPDIVSLVDKLAETRGPHKPQTLVSQDGRVISSVPRDTRGAISAYLKIADGCDASCAYCAIPLIKGPQHSKPEDEILREAHELADQGVREIVLIAQDTTSYGRDLGNSNALPGLLETICREVPDVPWIRLLYAYPQHVTPTLIETMARLPQICHYVDLPLQHAHPDVLKRMGRPHDVDAVRALISNLRSAMPDMVLRSTFIVGYPGETDEEFDTLLAFMEETRLDKVGVFAFSPEEGTAAANLPGRVSPEVIAERYNQAMRLQQEISLATNRAQVGRELDVLIEGVGDGLSVGRTYRDAPDIDGVVLIAQELEPGSLVRTRVVEGREYDLVAEPVSEDSE